MTLNYRFSSIIRFTLLMLVIYSLSCQANTKQEETSAFDNINNEIIIDLNNLTYTIANEHDQFYSFIGVRALAMVHLAMHDLFQAIEPHFEPYSYQKACEGCDPVAAAATSTRRILSKAYPGRMDTINLVCDKWLSTVEEGEAKQSGIALGKEVADHYIQLRDGDGHEKQGDYTPMTKPGDYQYTPEFDWVWKPDFTVARPFTLDSVSQFRSPAPPGIKSEVYSKDFEEVKSYGLKNSKVRADDETHYAHWWAEFAEHGWNRIGRLTAAERSLPLVETNRMFALINMNLYDFYLATFDSKYHYDTWRPYTAIRLAQNDGNPDTDADPNWEPEMLTPPWPEYPSAHAGAGAAGAEIVTHVYGTPDVPFTMQSVTAPAEAKERHYDNLDTAAAHCADSRIMNGFHFRFATEAGKEQGRAVAKHVIANYLKPVNK